MNRRALITFSVLSGLALAIGQYVAVSQSLYFVYWWLDIPMHLFGGVVVALAITTFIEFGKPFFAGTWITKGWNVVLIVLTIGILWEIFEMWLDITYLHLGFDWVDTLADICNDVIGVSIIAWLTAKDE